MRTIMLLAALTALGSMAIHMFVPAMPVAAVALGASPSEVQLTLTVYLFGTAGGQIAAGPAADRFGRRPVLLWGSALFVAGSALCWGSGSVAALIAGRLVQSLGASSGLVAGRAMVGDARDGRGARDMALLVALVMVSPMLAPVVGSFLADAAGWRSIFAALTIAAAFCGLGAFAWLHDDPARERPAATGLFAVWSAILRSGIFQRNLGVATALIGGLYLFLAASPFMLVEAYGADPHRLGYFYGAIALGGFSGALAANRLAGRWPPARIMRLGTALAAGAALCLPIGAWVGGYHIVALIAPMILYTFGGGLVGPNAMISALDGAPGRVGTAVSLYGALQMCGSAAATFAAAALPTHDPIVPVTAIALLAVAALLLTWRGSPSPSR